MSRHLSTKRSDLSQKISRQLTTKKRESYGDVHRHEDNYGARHKNQSLKSKDKYKTWARYFDEDDLEDDEYNSIR